MSRLVERDGGDNVSPSIIYKNQLPYIRGEFNKSDERIFFSPLDFALNGPEDGDEISKKHPEFRYTIHLKVIERVYSNKNEEVPMYVTVRVRVTYDDTEEDFGLADIIVYQCPEVRERYNFRVDSNWYSYYNAFAIYPQWWLEDDYRINESSPNNDLTLAVSIITGLCGQTLVSGYV